MAQDIEEFLRMAAARKKQQTQAQQAAPPQQVQESQSLGQHFPPSLSGEQADSFATDDAYSIDYSQSNHSHLEHSYPEHSHPDLQTSIKTTVSTADIAEHASHLGEQVHNRPDVVDSRVHDKFDHDLGQLQKAEITAPSIVDHGKGIETSTDISSVLDLIKNPNSLKQAVILKEILDRPKF